LIFLFSEFRPLSSALRFRFCRLSALAEALLPLLSFDLPDPDPPEFPFPFLPAKAESGPKWGNPKVPLVVANPTHRIAVISTSFTVFMMISLNHWIIRKLNHITSEIQSR
jgi:hypothetical protein